MVAVYLSTKSASRSTRFCQQCWSAWTPLVWKTYSWWCKTSCCIMFTGSFGNDGRCQIWMFNLLSFGSQPWQQRTCPGGKKPYLQFFFSRICPRILTQLPKHVDIILTTNSLTVRELDNQSFGICENRRRHLARWWKGLWFLRRRRYPRLSTGNT